MRAAVIAVAAITAAVAVALAWILLAADPRWSIDAFAGDDAGYYLAIARNIGLGLGVTFDRVSPTNGFNPLETLLLVAADRIAAPGLTVAGCYRADVMVSFVALLGAAWLYARLVAAFLADGGWSGALRRFALAACVAFFAWFVCLKNNFGMDGPLALLIGLAYLGRVFRRGLLAPGARAALADGALLGALFLARVDSLPFLAAAFALMLATRAAGTIARTAGRAATAAALAAPYLLWSSTTFGAWLPISARIKSSFPSPSLARSLDAIRHTSLHPFDQASFLIAFALALALAAAWWARARRDAGPALDRGRPAVLAILVLYLIGRLGYMLLFSRADVQGSYALLAHVFNVLVAIVVIETATRGAAPAARERRAATAFAVLLALATLLLAFKAQGLAARLGAIAPGGAGDEVALARAIHDHTRPGDVIYGGAFGMLAFWADRPWINGDGVANDAAYQRALRDDALAPLLAARGVTHVVFLAGPLGREGPRRLFVHGFLDGRDAALDVDERATVLRWHTLRGGGADIALARWAPRAGAMADSAASRTPAP
ncbi:MAG: hypothetical protein HYR74_07790 [Candidatus Eisenbacteria bacterium]|nr:hypothetical protein [Candidatus Eisenbacteria bacterium]